MSCPSAILSALTFAEKKSLAGLVAVSRLQCGGGQRNRILDVLEHRLRLLCLSIRLSTAVCRLIVTTASFAQE